MLQLLAVPAEAEESCQKLAQPAWILRGSSSQARTKSPIGSSPVDHRCVQLECARSTGSRSTAISFASGISAWMRRCTAGSCRYSGVDSPHSAPGAAPPNRAS